MRYRLFDEHVADLLAAVRHHAEHTRSVASSPAARASR
jgi:hypothetical protein